MRYPIEEKYTVREEREIIYMKKPCKLAFTLQSHASSWWQELNLYCKIIKVLLWHLKRSQGQFSAFVNEVYAQVENHANEAMQMQVCKCICKWSSFCLNCPCVLYWRKHSCSGATESSCQETWLNFPNTDIYGLSVTTGKPINLSKHHPSLCKRLIMVQLVC